MRMSHLCSSCTNHLVKPLSSHTSVLEILGGIMARGCVLPLRFSLSFLILVNEISSEPTGSRTSQFRMPLCSRSCSDMFCPRGYLSSPSHCRTTFCSGQTFFLLSPKENFSSVKLLKYSLPSLGLQVVYS